jgi:DNA-binding LytR/AlgR family response regulator
MIRETLSSFSGQLDPERFVRIHRRVIVAIGRVREIRTLPNGDSTLILQDGHALRASRSYRASIRAHLPKGFPRTAS